MLIYPDEKTVKELVDYINRLAEEGKTEAAYSLTSARQKLRGTPFSDIDWCCENCESGKTKGCTSVKCSNQPLCADDFDHCKEGASEDEDVPFASVSKDLPNLKCEELSEEDGLPYHFDDKGAGDTKLDSDDDDTASMYFQDLGPEDEEKDCVEEGLSRDFQHDSNSKPEITPAQLKLLEAKFLELVSNELERDVSNWEEYYSLLSESIKQETKEEKEAASEKASCNLVTTEEKFGSGDTEQLPEKKSVDELFQKNPDQSIKINIAQTQKQYSTSGITKKDKKGFVPVYNINENQAPFGDSLSGDKESWSRKNSTCQKTQENSNKSHSEFKQPNTNQRTFVDASKNQNTTKNNSKEANHKNSESKTENSKGGSFPKIPSTSESASNLADDSKDSSGSKRTSCKGGMQAKKESTLGTNFTNNLKNGFSIAKDLVFTVGYLFLAFLLMIALLLLKVLFFCLRTCCGICICIMVYSLAM